MLEEAPNDLHLRYEQLDPDHNGRVHLMEFCIAARDVGFKGDAKKLFRQMADAGGHSGYITLKELDPTGEALAEYEATEQERLRLSEKAAGENERRIARQLKAAQGGEDVGLGFLDLMVHWARRHDAKVGTLTREQAICKTFLRKSHWNWYEGS